MKTVERENRNRWAAAMLSIRADGTAGQNRPCSSTWGWKQEKLQRWEKYFLLTSPSIERFSKRVIALWLAGKLLKTKDAVRLTLDGLGTVGRLLG